jgi:glutamate-1-semialdehyde 2,1-aminomutase
MSATFNRSKELFNRAQKSIAGGINSGIRKLEQPVPVYFAKGSGPRIWDVDGNESIDYQLGQGALLYGHAPAGLADAISAQAKLGIHWAAQCELEIEVAERIQSMVPSVELVRFNNCATEAVMAAFRLARATTGRSKILRFEGHYHGWGDEGLVGFANPPSTWTDDDELPRTHPSKGIIPEVTDHFILSKWNDAGHLERMVNAHKGEIAAIIFEPALCNTCCIEPVAGFLQKIRELCDRDGILMISDETITGFRRVLCAGLLRLQAGPQHLRQGHRRRHAFRGTRRHQGRHGKDHLRRIHSRRHAQCQSALPRGQQVVPG